MTPALKALHLGDCCFPVCACRRQCPLWESMPQPDTTQEPT